jgi:hypothetical protein
MAAGHGQQQFEILVARAQVLVELFDVGAGQQVAAQQFERRLQMIMDVRERQMVRVGRQPIADHGGDGRQRAPFVAQPEQIGGCLVRQGGVHTVAAIVGRCFGPGDGLEHQRKQLRIGVRHA